MKFSYLCYLSFKTIIKKKHRTLLSIGTTLICTAMITASLFMMVFVFRIHQLKNEEYEPIHYYLVSDEVNFSSRYDVCVESKIKNSHIYGLTLGKSVFPFSSMEGHYPMNDKELIIPKNAGKIGDFIDGYEVVGIYESKITNRYYTNDVGIIQGYYIYDTLGYLMNAKQTLIQDYQLNEENLTIYKNNITQLAIEKYLPNDSFILLIYGLMILLCLMISFICMHNILVISDQTRRNELGLLKSVGCPPQGILSLFLIELLTLGFFGCILGGMLGSQIADYLMGILKTNLYLTDELSTLTQILLGISGMVIGYLIFVLSGIKAYQPYIHSSVISDLKNQGFEYHTNQGIKESRRQSFSWKMFLIYNRRMKKQTKNIFVSFTMVLCIAILFSSVYFVTLVYNNTYTENDADFVIKNDTYSNVEFLKAIETLKTDYVISDLRIFTENRTSWDVKVSSFNEELLNHFPRTVYDFYLDENNRPVDYASIYFYTLFYRQDQLDLLKPYLVEGSLDDLKWNDVVLVASSEDRFGAKLCENFEVGNLLYRESVGYRYDDEPAFIKWQEFEDKLLKVGQSISNFHLKAIVHLPSSAYDSFYFPYGEYPRVMVLSYEAASQITLRSYDQIEVKLENKMDAISLQKDIDQLLEIYDQDQHYSYTNYALIISNYEHITFILVAILYPMLMMLLALAYINLYYVLSGNLLLKQHDVQIIKSIGAKTKQLQLMFVFEYLENYLNSCFALIFIFIPISFMVNGFKIFDASGNILASFIIAVFILGPIFLTPIIFLTLSKIKKIRPLFMSTTI